MRVGISEHLEALNNSLAACKPFVDACKSTRQEDLDRGDIAAAQGFDDFLQFARQRSRIDLPD